MIARLENTPVLTTERLTLRAPQASDFEVFAPFVMSDRARYIGGGADKDIGHAWRVLAILSGHWHLRGFGTFVGDRRMTDATTRAAELLKGHRESIDRLDAILVYTLGERFKHTQAVGKLKAEHDLPPSDPAREAAQIARLEDLAKRADLDPEFAKKFLNFIIAKSFAHTEHQS
jgi:chorismate mutase